MLARYILSSRVHLSVCYKLILYRNDWTHRAGFGMEASFHLSHTVLLGIWVSPKIRYFPLHGTLSQTPDLKFRRGKLISLSTTLVVIVLDSRVCWRHLYDSRRVVAVYYKSVNCNPLLLHYFELDLFYNLFLQLTRCWLTQRVARSVCGSSASCLHLRIATRRCRKIKSVLIGKI